MFTCPNPACRKGFTNPLKTVNVRQDPTELYNACPYCLTKIDQAYLDAESKLKKDKLEESPDAENDYGDKEQVKETDKPVPCHYHLGYLSERAQKEQIPDDCLVCKDILECMLKKMQR